jgi:predicted TPR repeat methyltransferase
VNEDGRDPNALTLEAYQRHVNDYISRTPKDYTEHHEALLRWIDKSLEALIKGAKIFEVGSATGREAKYMRSKGYDVVCSDAVEGFVRHLKEIGENALRFNLLKDELPKNYNMIFANAVLPHFSEDELKYVLKKVHGSLQKGNLFAFSVKQGSGKQWISEKISDLRFVQYWQPEDLYRLISECGFHIVYSESGTTGDEPNHIWINLTVSKL